MSTTVSNSRTGNGRAVQTTLVVLAAGQLISAVLVNAVGGAFTTADRAGEPPIVPVGWAFSIWSVVIVLSIGYAVWALPAARPDPVLRARLARPLSVVFAGFSMWLIAAELEPTWTTVVVFVVMLAGLLRALGIALAQQAVIARWSPLGRRLLWGLLGVYTGWSSIAVWVNLSTGLASSGAPITGPVGVAWQFAVLVGATATAVAVLCWTGGLLPYAAAVGWALATAALGAAGAGEPYSPLCARSPYSSCSSCCSAGDARDPGRVVASVGGLDALSRVLTPLQAELPTAALIARHQELTRASDLAIMCVALPDDDRYRGVGWWARVMRPGRGVAARTPGRRHEVVPLPSDVRTPLAARVSGRWSRRSARAGCRRVRRGGRFPRSCGPGPSASRVRGLGGVGGAGRAGSGRSRLR